MKLPSPCASLLSSRPRLPVLALAAGLLLPRAAKAQTAAEVRQATGIETGLAVVLGGDGQLATALTDNGKMLAHGLAVSEGELASARAAALAKNRYGFASFDRAVSFSRLPYGDNLVNLVVSPDQGAWEGKGLTEKEVLRVLVPNGVGYLKRGGSWTKVVKPRPATSNDWGHWNLGPEGNQVSDDPTIGPLTMLKWVTFSGGTRIGDAEYNCNYMRVADGRLYHDWISHWTHSGNQRDFLMGRDSYNGLGIWLRKMAIWQGNFRHDQAFAAGGNRVVTVLAPGHYNQGGPLTALDGRTGEVEKEFTSLPNSSGMGDLNAVYVGGKVIGVAKSKIAVFDTGTWAEKWSYTEPGGNIFFYPIAAPELNKVFVVTGPLRGDKFWRAPHRRTHSLVCFNLQTGKVEWRDDRFAAMDARDGSGKGLLTTQLMYRNGSLLLFCSANHGPMEQAKAQYLGMYDPANGQLRWERNAAKDPDSLLTKFWSLHQAMIRDDAVLMVNPNNLGFLDKASGKLLGFYDHITNSWGGGRCNKGVATSRYLLGGALTYVDKDADRTSMLQEITRSNCAIGAFIANGMTYFTPAGCNCFAMINGLSGYTSEPLPQATPDAARLEKFSAPAAKGGALAKAGNYTPAGYAPSAQEVWRTAVPAEYAEWVKSPVAIDWLNNRRMNYTLRSDTLNVNGTAYFSLIHEHRLEAWKGGQKQWSFIAGGRITKAPVHIGGKLYFGCHDGYVYCLDAATGKMDWRFLGAQSPSLMMAYGQLESQWPVFGVAAYGDRIYFSAGRHPELAGGILVWGLDTKDQKVVLKTAIRFNRPWQKWSEIEKLKKPKRGVTNENMNAIPTITGTTFNLPKFSLDLVTGAMTLNTLAYKEQTYIHPVSLRKAAAERGVAFALDAGHFELGEAAAVELRVLDPRGKAVATLFQGRAEAGRHSFDDRAWQAGRHPGWYVMLLQTPFGTAKRVVPVGIAGFQGF